MKLKVGEGLRLLLLTTICIVTFMIIMPTIVIKSKDNNTQSESELNDGVINQKDNQDDSSEIVLNSSNKVKVYITEEDRIEEIDLEEYISGVVSNEMPAAFEAEALKAQAIAARTFLSSRKVKNCPKAQGAEVCDSVHCQVYTSKEKRLEKWDDGNAETYWNKIKEAVDATSGMVLTYEGELVLYPQFFSTSSGKTENASDTTWGDIPYLKSVISQGEEIAPKFSSEKVISLDEFVSIVNSKYPNSGVSTSNLNGNIEIISRSEAGGVKQIKIGNETVIGSDFRFLIGLNSANFTYSIDDSNITFECKGYGHGVGMSQWGANVMAKNGSTYTDILKHYYSGVNIQTLKFNQ